MSDEVTIRAYQPGDEHALVEGYNAIFPQSRSLEHWYWKFRDAPIGDNPIGRTQVAVAESADAGIVGTYTSMMVRVRMEGEDLLAAQGLDMWVYPEFRRKAPRPGLFVHVGWKHYELFGGTAPGQARFHYGWPIPNWRIGQRYLRYENIRDWDFLFRETPADGFPDRASSAELEVTRVERYGSREVEARASASLARRRPMRARENGSCSRAASLPTDDWRSLLRWAMHAA